MKALILFIIFIFILCVGVQNILEGEILHGVLLLCIPVSPFVAVFLLESHKKIYERHQEHLAKKYNLPEYVGNDNFWEKKFKKVIAKVIESTSDSAKLSCLEHCQSVVEEMNKGADIGLRSTTFSKINQAFRYTGCHLTITDSEGKSITKIV